MVTRESRFLEDISNSSARRQLSAKKEKEIYIQKVTNDDIKPLKISMNRTVKELKKEIEKLFKLSYSLDEYALRVKGNGMSSGKLIYEQDENKTLFANGFTLQCYVLFGKDKFIGG